MSENDVAAPQTVGVRRANDFRWGGENPGADRIVNPNTHHGSGTQDQPEADSIEFGASPTQGRDLSNSGPQQQWNSDFSKAPSEAQGPDSATPRAESEAPILPAPAAEAEPFLNVPSEFESGLLSTLPPYQPNGTTAPLRPDGISAFTVTPIEEMTDGQNQVPVAQADVASTDEDTSLSGNVLLNDSDADASDSLTVSAVDGASANV
ncbi:MAG TPA: hypothetical protein VH933_12995, partial [Aestuariivirgaceae bacterium]